MNKKIIVPIIQTSKKLTTLDWFFCCAILMVFIFLLVNRASKEQQWISVKLKVSNDEWLWQANNPYSWYGMSLSKGQSAYTSFGKKVAEIQSIENYDMGGPRRLIFANVKLLATYNKKTQTYSFAYQPLQIGKPLDFTFGQNNLHGLVTYIGDDIVPYGSTNIQVKLFTLYPWEANSYTKDSVMKDLDENIIGTIDDVEITDSTITKILDINERYIFFPVPANTYKDVAIRLSVRTYQVNNIPYFIDGSAIKIGNRIWLEFEHTAIKNGIISNIYQ